MALALGGMTVAELKERMTHAEFIRWIAYSRMEPWGYDMDNWRAGLIASTMANVNRGRKGKSYKPSDFMPQRQKTQREVQQDVRQIFKAGFDKK